MRYACRDEGRSRAWVAWAPSVAAPRLKRPRRGRVCFCPTPAVRRRRSWRSKRAEPGAAGRCFRATPRVRGVCSSALADFSGKRPTGIVRHQSTSRPQGWTRLLPLAGTATHQSLAAARLANRLGCGARRSTTRRLLSDGSSHEIDERGVTALMASSMARAAGRGALDRHRAAFA
jgi:hypothetical protein